MPTNDKLIAHGRIGLALKIIKQQSTMDIILENIQTVVREQQQISDADDDAYQCFSNWRERGWRYG